MTAIEITRAGGPEVLQPKTRPVPKPAAGHVLIQVAFAGVNRHDCGQRIRGFGPKGANVVTTVGNAAKRDFCLKIGAHAAINYREQDFVAEIDKITSSHGADVILDMAGAAYAKRNLQALAMDGRVMHLSSGDSKEYSVALGAIMSKRGGVRFAIAGFRIAGENRNRAPA